MDNFIHTRRLIPCTPSCELASSVAQDSLVRIKALKQVHSKRLPCVNFDPGSTGRVLTPSMTDWIHGQA